MVYQVGNAEEKDLYRQGFLSVHIDITNRCNLGCAHCYARCNSDTFIETLSSSDHRVDNQKISDLGKIIEKVETESGTLKIFYELSGGEPLMHEDWEEVLRLFLSTGREVYLFSNATLVDEITARRIASLSNEYLGRLKFNSSLDSHLPQIHDLTRGKFKETMRGLHLLISQGIKPKIDVTINSYNQSQIIDTFRFIATNLTPEIILGVLRPVFPITSENVGLFVPYQEIVDVSRKLTDIAKQEGWEFYCTLHRDGRAYCDAGINHLLIDINGDTTPCYSLRLPRYKMGNIYQGSFREILANIISFNKQRDRKVLLCEHLGEVYGEPPVKLERLD